MGDILIINQQLNTTKIQSSSEDKTTLIWDKSGEMPEGSKGYYWSGYQDDGNRISLLQLVEENSDYVRGNFFKIRATFLSDLYQKLSSFSSPSKIEIKLLWMSLLVESGMIKPSKFLDVFRLLSLEEEILSKNIKNIKYVGPQKTVADALCKLSQKLKISFAWEKSSTKHVQTLLRRFWNILPRSIRSPIWLLKYIYKRWPLRDINGINWFSGSKSVFVFSVFAHMDKDSCNLKKFYSKQWEILPELLLKAGKLMNWGHLFLFSKDVPDTSTGIGWLQSFNLNSQNQGFHVFLDTYLSSRLILKCLLDWTKIQFFYFHRRNEIEKPLDKNKYGWIWPILEKDWRDSLAGVTAMNNILLIHLFDKLMESVPYQKQGFYLCENQGWERAFLYAWRKHGHGRIIGVAHATIRYWDLRYFDSSISAVIPDLPRPDALAVNGPAAWLNLQNAGQRMSKCVRVEALRYINLYNISPDSEKKNSPSKIKKSRLLVLGDIQWETTHRMMLILEKLYEKLNFSYEVWIKPHPHNYIELKNYSNLDAIYMDYPLKELLPEIDVTLASVFTSGELDSYCSGVPVINYLDPDNLNFSNLRGSENAKFISTADELFDALNIPENVISKTGTPEDFFWLDPHLKKWKFLLDEGIISKQENLSGNNKKNKSESVFN